ncbi:MAG: DUF2974 domain-containing protein [Elusimicrobiales bacterium]|nr:DUF2974 domain-containing protein [Elusimicrobiales bacterium]
MTITTLVLAAFLLSPAPSAAAEDLQSIGAAGVMALDTSAFPAAKAAPDRGEVWVGGEFEAIFSAGKDFSSSEISRLKNVRILLVPGFMSNLATTQGGQKALPFVPRYFKEQLEFLKGRGLDCRLVDIESETSIYSNARKVIRELEQAPGKVMVIGHSKGGLDTLEALLKRPDLRRKVLAVIAVQSPFLGSPVADMVLASPATSVPSSVLLELLGGSKQSLQNLSVKYREDYHKRHESEIRELTRQVPFYSYSTWKDDSFLPYIDTVFEVFRDYMLALGLKNDGLVPAQSAVLPGSRYVYMAGTDHLCTIMWVPLPFFDRVGFIKSAIKLALRT